jgi:cupin fold WbuC family metalloprotein
MIEGALDIVVFDERGTPIRAIQLASNTGSRPFYYRLNEALYHAILPRTPLVVFHETTTGPFSKNDAEFADWAPQPPLELRAFLEHAMKVAAAPRIPSAER